MTKITRRTFLNIFSGSLIGSLSPAAFAKNKSNTVRSNITAVRLWPASAYTRLTIESTNHLDFKQFTLSNPNRLVIDLYNTTINNVLKGLPEKVIPLDPHVARIRIGQATPETVRIVLDLKSQIAPQVFTLKPIAHFKNRLVVDLYPAHETQIDSQEDPLLALLQDYNQGKIRSDGSSTTVAKNRPPKTINRQPIIMIDPGHGGEDPGAIGKSGLREKDVVLAIARETKKRLDAMGYKTYMTRNEDIFIPLGVRVAKARKLKADVFVSIHADAFTRPTARGTGVYALSEKGATSAAAKFLAHTQNESDQIGGVSYSSDKIINTTLFDLAQTATINDSIRLGNRVLAQLGKINKLHKGHVDQANFAVLRAPDIPSILIETAFLSNPLEEKLLASNPFRKKTADSIASGIKNYLDTAVLARR